MPTQTDSGLRRVVLIVALLNLAYFGIEFAVALAIGGNEADARAKAGNVAESLDIAIV